MNDQTNITPQATDPNAAIPPSPTGEPAAPLLPDDYQPVRTLFTPAALEQGAAGAKAVALAVTYASVNGLPVDSNFDTNGNLPDGYGMAIIPLTRQRKGEERGYEIVGLALDAVPLMDAIQAAEGGAEYIQDVIERDMLAKLARAHKLGNADALPRDVVDFITNQRATSNMEAWNALAPKFVDALRENDFGGMKKERLRQVLASEEAAAQYYHKVPQSNWEVLLRVMIARAEELGLRPGILIDWLETRKLVKMDQGREFTEADILAAIGPAAS